MKPATFVHSRVPSRRGSAVLVVLAFVVIISFVLLLFLSRSQTALSQSEASTAIAKDDLTESIAMQAIIEDFRNEMLAGSSGATLPSTGMPMVVTDARAMVPGRVLTTGVTSSGTIASTGAGATFINLIKQSAYGKAFYPGSATYTAGNATYTGKTSGVTTVVPAAGLSRASNVNTSQASANGRVISAARWSKPMLLSSTSSTAATFAANQLPDWIYVTRNGPATDGSAISGTSFMNATPSNNAYVVGRYAYNIYDEGGLLDANVAGFDPANVTANLVAAEGQKGSSGFADLSLIPGMTSTTAFVNWRNKASNTTSTAPPNYLAMIGSFGEPSGFSKLFTTGSGSTLASDNRFFTRQDLLNYQASHTTVLTTQALSYLTTFSADLNQPSIVRDPSRPTVQRAAASGGNDAYGVDNLVNPDFPSTLDSGNPVMQERFPLDRLAWLTYMGPISDDTGTLKTGAAYTTIIGQLETSYGMSAAFLSEGTAANIKKYFGLVWYATKPTGGPSAISDTGGYWLYDSGQLSVRGGLNRLSEVSGREPNFFEILKASILCGSLGQQYQSDTETADVTGLPTSSTDPRIVSDSNGNLGRDGVIDNHVMQIGANIIDQFDVDSVPTRLLLTTNGWLVTGVEDLPYLYGLRAAPYDQAQVNLSDMGTPATNATPFTSPVTASSGQNSTPPYRDFVMLQPMIWNPHAAPAIAVSGTTPTSFRVAAVDPGNDVSLTSGPVWWKWNGSGAQPAPYNNQYTSIYPSSNALDKIGGGPIGFSASTDYISFQTQTTGGASFRDPYFLRAPNYPPGSNSANSGSAGAPTTMQSMSTATFNDPSPPSGYSETGTGSDQPIGFMLGYIWNQAIDTTTDYFDTFFVHANNLTVNLQYQDAGGNWITYDQIIDMPTYYGGSILRAQPRARIWTRLDPRNDRMGYRDSTIYSPFPKVPPPSGTTSNTANYWAEGRSMRFDATPGKLGTGLPISPFTNASFNWTFPTGTLSTTPVNNFFWGLIAENDGINDKLYYNDPDGVNRNGMGINASGLTGLPMATSNGPSHPIMLNRPFKSVAELGYVFRGVAWKQLDFFTPQSGDAALLDAFCLHESTTTSYVAGTALNQVQAGKVSLNAYRPEVLEAMLRGVSYATSDTPSSDRITDADALKMATDLVAWTGSTADPSAGPSPLRNRSELVAKYASGATGSFSGFSTKLSDLSTSNAANQAISMRRMAVMRGLADMGTTRTWTFMVDLIVQTGRFPETTPSTALDQFVVRGEKHYWVHLAIDRFTGAVVSQRTEIVNE